MRPVLRGASRVILAVLACPIAATVGAAAPAAQPAIQAAPVQVPPVPGADPTPEAGPGLAQPCGARAARYESGKGFNMVITRAGQVRVANPLRPLTPEVTEVLQVVIAGKIATAYGPDFATLRRGTAPAAVEAMLGGSIQWQPTLPTLADPIAIVSEEGTPLAQLTFRACEEAPAVKAAPKPQAKKKVPAKRPAPKAAEKTPPGFSMPQGAIAE